MIPTKIHLLRSVNSRKNSEIHIFHEFCKKNVNVYHFKHIRRWANPLDQNDRIHLQYTHTILKAQTSFKVKMVSYDAE